MGSRMIKNSYRTERHVFVPIEHFYHALMREHTRSMRSQAFYGVIDIIPAPEERHREHLNDLAGHLGLLTPYIAHWKGIAALILPGTKNFTLARQKGVKTMTPDELDDVMIAYHDHKDGLRL